MADLGADQSSLGSDMKRGVALGKESLFAMLLLRTIDLVGANAEVAPMEMAAIAAEVERENFIVAGRGMPM